jgi:hypothetical protein
MSKYFVILSKTLISHLECTTHFWKSPHQVRSNVIDYEAEYHKERNRKT